MSDPAAGGAPIRRVFVSARVRLTLSYALFLVGAGAATLVGVYLVLRYVPNYPLTAANPSDLDAGVASRGEILDTLMGVSGTILLGFSVLGLLGGWFVAGRMLRPLREINRATELAAAGNLGHRIRLRGHRDEFGQFADRFDHMLDRLGDAFETQERFAANASHELRTPLAITATLLEVARRDPEGQDYPQLVDRLSQTNQRAIELSDALLRLASVDAVTAASDATDLAEIGAEALAENAAEAAAAGVTVHRELAPTPLLGDGALLHQLATNLLQNAIRHNAPGGALRLRVAPMPARGAEPAGAVLRVENTGPEVTAELLARATEPFARGAGRTRTQERVPGHGLGLALAARIVAVHGGELSLKPRPGGGLVATAIVPVR